MPKPRNTRKELNRIEYLTGEEELLDRVGPLWDMLNEHHAGLQKDFSEYYTTRTYEGRRKEFLEHSKAGKIFVDIAIDKDKKRDIGYCVTTVSAIGKGEIESIFIEPNYRSQGIGDRLMRDALDWLEEGRARPVTLIVASGNERVVEFYRKHGFAPKHTVLEYKG